MKGEKVEDIQCPVCGYYCLGEGGAGCIDKLSMYRAQQDVQPMETLTGIHKELQALNYKIEQLLIRTTSYPDSER